MPPATLSNLIANDNDQRVFCDCCHWRRDLDVGALVSRYGAATELPETGKRARYGECGGKGTSVQVVVVRW